MVTVSNFFLTTENPSKGNDDHFVPANPCPQGYEIAYKGFKCEHCDCNKKYIKHCKGSGFTVADTGRDCR